VNAEMAGRQFFPKTYLASARQKKHAFWQSASRRMGEIQAFWTAEAEHLANMGDGQ
jgi:hypothetical protein